MIIEQIYGGRELKSYPLVNDPKTGKLGYKIGYHNGEPVILRSADMDRILLRFWGTRNNLKTRMFEWITK